MDSLAASEIEAARQALYVDRGMGLAMLDALFRDGEPPSPPVEGRTHGDLLALDIAPGATQVLGWVTALWLPWRGKTFDPAHSRGDNIFMAGSRAAARFFNPGYQGFIDDGPDTYRAFSFRTYVAASREDDDRNVLKIDYDLPENPGATIGRVLDELVQIGEGTYLGKAHVHWWWGQWQRVAFFGLIGADSSS